MGLEVMLRQIAGGMGVTLQIFVVTLVFSLPLGLLVSFGRMSKNRILSTLVKFYISVMRGTPLMLQIMVVYYCPYYLFHIQINNSYRLWAAFAAFVINYAAYFAEIYRSGIQSMPTGQYEAAEVLGYSRVSAFFKIILPQVIKRILPAVTNEVITLVKDTSLAYTISVLEMFNVAKSLSVSQTSMSFVSQNVGARRFARVDQVVLRCMLLSAGVGILLGNSAYLLGRWLLGIYTPEPQVITYGLYRMSVVCTTYFLCGWMDCLACSVRGLGSSMLPMIVSILGACVLRIIWVMTLFQWERTQMFLYISYTVSWAITAAVHLICFLILRRKVRTAQPAA